MRKTALVIVSALILASCGGKVDMYRGDAANSGVFSDGVGTLHDLKWKFTTRREI